MAPDPGPCASTLHDPVLTRTICEYTSRASGPDTRITPIPPLHGGVGNLYIVFFSVGDRTTFVAKRLTIHSFGVVAFQEDRIGDERQRSGNGWGKHARNRSFLKVAIEDIQARVNSDLDSSKAMSRIRKGTSLLHEVAPHAPFNGAFQRLASEQTYTSARRSRTRLTKPAGNERGMLEATRNGSTVRRAS